MVYRPLYLEYRPPTHGISNRLPMVYRPSYPWYIDTPTHGISTPPHGISTLYLWYIDPPYPWYIDPLPIISTPLPMVYRPPYP